MSKNINDNARRAFLGRSAAATGGVLLALGGVASAEGKKDEAKVEGKVDEKTNESILKLKEHDKLSPVGGFAVIETEVGKIIVAHCEADKYVACSAICTHKGCEIGYEHDKQQFSCPCHFAAFALDGTVKRGPAKKNLQSYAADAAAVVALTVP